MYQNAFKTLLTILPFLKLVNSKYVCETDDTRLDNFFFVKGSEDSKANGRYTIFDYAQSYWSLTSCFETFYFVISAAQYEIITIHGFYIL